MFSIEDLQEKVNAEMMSRVDALSEKKPKELYSPVKYSLEMGGKRLRPVMLLLAYNLFSDEIDSALPAAVAIEVFHNFTLLHDDIMDDAKVRRNRPTVHMEFSENSAVLSGDVMAFLSYQYLMECKSERMFDVAALFTATAVEVCEGQQYDMDFEKRYNVTADEYLSMIRLKTAVLLACGLKGGALLADADDDVANLLYEFGLNLGMAFQLQDDLLDTFGNSQTFGKKIGGDILSNKKTFLLIKALERASGEELQKLKHWLTAREFNEEDKIKGVTRIFRQTGIKEITEEKIDFFFQRSSALLEQIPVEETKKNHLKALGRRMLKRNH